jgi:hypothetical protein
VLVIKRRRSKGVFAVITLALLGICFILSGVLAVTNITVNNGSGLSIGSGAAAATSCDNTVSLSTQNTFDSTSGMYKLATISVTDVDTSSSYCANKVMYLAIVLNNTAYQASWSLPSSAINNSFIFSQSTSSANSGNNYFASNTFIAQDPATLGTFAISIS